MTNHHLPFFKLSLQSHSIAEGSACPIKMPFQPQWTVENLPKMARYCHRLGNLGLLWKWRSFWMFKIELCYFFLLSLLCRSGFVPEGCKLASRFLFRFHLARYTQIALCCNVCCDHIEGMGSANVHVFSYKKSATASFFSKRVFCFGLTVVPEWVEESYLEGYEVLKRHIDSPASKTSSGEPQSHYWGYLLALNANKGTGLLDHIIAACAFNALSSKSNESGFNIIIEHLFVHEGVLSVRVCPCWREQVYEWIKAQERECVYVCAYALVLMCVLWWLAVCNEQEQALYISW